MFSISSSIISSIHDKILNLENTISERDTKQEERIENLNQQLTMLEGKVKEIEKNVLFYRFDAESETLDVYGSKWEESGNE